MLTQAVKANSGKNCQLDKTCSDSSVMTWKPGCNIQEFVFINFLQITDNICNEICGVLIPFFHCHWITCESFVHFESTF